MPPTLELAPDVAACRAREQNDEVVELAGGDLERCDEHVGALDRLRLEPLGHPDAVLLERADDERVLRQAEQLAAPRRAARRRRAETARARSRSGSGGRAPARRPPRRTSSSISRWVTWTRSNRAAFRRERVEGSVELRVARRSRGARGSTQGRAGATSPSRAGRALRSGSCGRRPGRAAKRAHCGGPSRTRESRATPVTYAASSSSAQPSVSPMTNSRERGAQPRVRKPTAACRSGLPRGARRERAGQLPLPHGSRG